MEFRHNGIHATGIAEVMVAAGLTQGGFYRHFASKDQLVAEACAEAMSVAVSTTQGAPADTVGKPALEAIVRNVLSMEHRDSPLECCPLVGLGIELARADGDTRTAASNGFMELSISSQASTGGSARKPRANARCSCCPPWRAR